MLCRGNSPKITRSMNVCAVVSNHLLIYQNIINTLHTFLSPSSIEKKRKENGNEMEG